MIIIKYTLLEYRTEKGRNPYQQWLNTLDTEIQQRIEARIFRFELGNLGDSKALGRGIFEARFTIGPGYRVYFGIEGKTIVILLRGGDKKTQKKDILTAKRYWNDYLERGNHGSKKY